MYETYILVNEDLVRGASIEELNKSLIRYDFNIETSFEEAVVHETGHAKTIYANRFGDISKLYKELETISIDDISKLASGDGAEAIAEIEVLLHRGETISDEARKLYERVMKGDI